MSEKGICGTFNIGVVRGVLLDNVGQLFGLWVMFNMEINCLVMFVKVDVICFYNQYLKVGQILECCVEVI